MLDVTQLIVATENRYSATYNSLVQALSHLINNDLEQLVQLLYKIDISEQKLKDALKNHSHENAAVIIADMIIERQAEKIKSFKQSKPRSNIDEDEKW